ncbi:hypothetical protein F5X99DRAFT_406200 [Biscogniauxia marginata]|nr:hypothetical protein F5X99DRAFT_406200 [Biscogniauxia marginata]
MAPPAPGIKLNADGVPDFDDLPLREGDPRYAAWGLYGDGDELGTLNRITDERVADAARGEIRSGKRISLNWPLDAQPRRSFFQRALFHQDITPKAPRAVNDDVWTFNSQVSTQWDGLRHFAYQREGRFYGGRTQADIHAVDDKGKRATVLGVHAWAEQGIVGRGILIDYHGWRESQGDTAKAFDSFASVSIPLEDLKACLAAQGTEISLPLRPGFHLSLARKSPDELWAHQDRVPHPFGGVQQSEDVLRWIWSSFAAVAGDQPTFECWPAQNPDWSMHEVLLAGWGCPIGELFDLEALAAHCRRERRWSFFLASEPCCVPGGVASPANAVAIF